MKVSEEVVLSAKPGIRDQDLRMELVDYGSTCGKTASIELPQEDGVRDQNLKLELIPIGTPTNTAAVTLPQKDGVRDQDLKLEFVPVGCDAGGLAYCTCFPGTVSGVGNWGDFNHQFSQSFNDSYARSTPSYRPRSYWSKYSFKDRRTYFHGSCSHIHTNGWFTFNQQSVGNGSTTDPAWSESWNDKTTRTQYWMQNTNSTIKQRGNQFYGTPWFLGSDLEMNYSMHFDVQHGFDSNDVGVWVGPSFFKFDDSRVGLSDSRDTRNYQTDRDDNERYVGGGFSGFGYKSTEFNQLNNITLDGEDLDITHIMQMCDFFSPADLIIDGTILNENTSGYSSIKHGWNDPSNWSSSTYNTWDGLGTANHLVKSVWSEKVETKKWHNETDAYIVGNTRKMSSTETDAPTEAYQLVTPDEGFLGYEEMRHWRLTPVSHNSYCFVIHLGIHYPKRYEARGFSITQNNGTIDDGNNLSNRKEVNAVQLLDPDNFSVGWGLYLVGCEQVYGPFSVSGHLTKYFEEVPSDMWRGHENEAGNYVNHALKEKLLLSDNEDDVKFLEDFIKDINKSPQEVSFTQVEPRKELEDDIFQSEYYDYQPNGDDANDNQQYKWAKHTQYYDSDWLGDRPFTLSVQKARCELMPPTTFPYLRIWVYAIPDPSGDDYMKSGSFVRMDWSFTNEKWQGQQEPPTTNLRKYKDRGYEDTPVPEDKLSKMTLEYKDEKWIFEYKKGEGKIIEHNGHSGWGYYGDNKEYYNHYYELRYTDRSEAPLPDSIEITEERASPLGGWYADGDTDTPMLFRISGIDPDCSASEDPDICPPLIARHKE